MHNNLLVYAFYVRSDLLFGILNAAAAVSGDPGDRVNESTPRAAATTRQARTPTAAQYHIRVLETLPQPAYVCWTNCSSSGIPQPLRAIVRYSRIRLYFWPRSATLIGQLSLVPVFDTNSLQHIVCRIFLLHVGG